MKLAPEEVERLRQLHREFDIRVSSIGSPIGKVKLADREDGTTNVFVPFSQYLKESVQRVIDLAHAFETKLIRGFSFYPPKGSNPAEYLSQAVERVGAIAEACGKEEVIYGLEVEANLVGHDGESMAAIYRRVNHPNLVLVFDAANILVQCGSLEKTVSDYFAMRDGLGWLHIKDYKVDQSLEWKGHVNEEMLKNFLPSDQGDAGHELILRDLKTVVPQIEKRLRPFGVPGVFLDLEPHLKGGGQFGGFSGPDGFGVALRSLQNVLDYVGIGYRLRDYADIARLKGK
jgi:sugar phosphate isomerase/epimerase